MDPWTTLFGLLINFYLPIDLYVVSGESMTPFLNDGDIVIAKNNISENDIMRENIVVFKEYNDNNSLLIKRIIGTPGECVTFEPNDSIIIEDTYGNKFELNEEYLPPAHKQETFEYQLENKEFTCPDRKYFVLGDNRGNSLDSRAFNHTYIDINDIQGKVLKHIDIDFIYNIQGYASGYQIPAYYQAQNKTGTYFRLFKGNDNYLKNIDLDWARMIKETTGLIYFNEDKTSGYFDKIVAVNKLDLIYINDNQEITEIIKYEDLNVNLNNFSLKEATKPFKYIIAVNPEVFNKTDFTVKQKFYLLANL